MNLAELSWSEILLVRVVWSELLSLGRVVLHPYFGIFPYAVQNGTFVTIKCRH